MRLRSARLFIFIEGSDTDPFFYPSICHKICLDSEIEFELVKANRISADGGKQVLLDFHSYLSRNNWLVMRTRKGRKTSLFYLDKDLDDLLNRKKHCEHICYTEHYSVENYLFTEVDYVACCGAAGSFDPFQISNNIRDAKEWLAHKPMIWKEFLSLAIYTHKMGFSSICNMGQNSSPLNLPPSNATDVGLYEKEVVRISTKYGKDLREINRSLSAIQRLLASLEKSGRIDKVFKGKWYVNFLSEEMKRIFPLANLKNVKFDSALLGILRAKLDFSRTFVNHFQVPLKQVIGKL